MSARDRQDSVPVHDNRSPENARKQRNYTKCNQCRRDHKSCIVSNPTSPDTPCTRCRGKGWPCGERVRAQTAHNNVELFTQERMTIIATRRLLRSCLQADRRLKSLMYPWPCGTWGQKPKSSILQKDFGVFASRLDLQMGKLDNILDQLGGYEVSVESDLVRSARQIIGGNASAILACIAHIQPEWHDHGTVGHVNRVANGTPPSPDHHYASLSNLVRMLLHTHCSGTEGLLGPGSGTFVSISNGFPPCHIAYLNGAKDSAVRLWWRYVIQPYLSNPTQTVYADQTVDLIGRTFPQLVAEAGDFETLRKIDQCAKGVMLHANHDKRGLSLLALAVCAPGGPDFEILSMLLSQRPWALSQHHGPEPSILDLALLSRKKELVLWILSQQAACESFDGYVRKAIELGEASMALLFVPWLNEAERVSQDIVNDLAILAREKQKEWTEIMNNMGNYQEFVHAVRCWLKGFPELVEALENTVVRSATAQQIVADINQAPLGRRISA